MKNHIKAKFLGFEYKVPEDTYQKELVNLTEALRANYPVFGNILHKNIQLDLDNDKIETTENLLLRMVDSEKIIGLKVDSSRFSISSSEYRNFDEMMETLRVVAEVVFDTLKISHTFRVFLKNINLFEETGNKKFADIKNDSYWGPQKFETMETWNCVGASTRHEYTSVDKKISLQVMSGIAVGTQTYIPEEEWDIWHLRGGVPTQEKQEKNLVISISASKQEIVGYDWSAMKNTFNELHGMVNNVYGEIIKGEI